ncbi:hypothetical protein EZV62_019054 [Acer yangbiense]|uniref:RNA helicase C-terminal domain-containing protein n=1 Tax=Acer yangbiense TaxID=1000413 RepID=A0A5C7HA11_9ROSI|nr:hypothetical protein EZV62_019054 [Acer yangbiense]
MCIIFKFVYSQVETNKVFLRDTTVISPFSILLFGGSINIQHQVSILSILVHLDGSYANAGRMYSIAITGQVIIDGWLKLTAPAQTAVLFKELRSTLQTIWKEMIRNPEVKADRDESSPYAAMLAAQDVSSICKELGITAIFN